MKKFAIFFLALAFSTAVMAQKIGYCNSAALVQDLPEVKQADSDLQAFQAQLTKKGQEMSLVRIGDQFADTELILFPSIFQQTLGIWERDRIVLVRGRVNARDREGNLIEDIKVMVDDAREVTPDQANAYQPTGKKPKVLKASKKTVPLQAAKPAAVAADPRLYIRLTSSDNADMLLSLKAVIDQHQGDTEVVLVIGPESSKQIIRLPMRIAAKDPAHGLLSELVGAENIKLY